MTTRDGNEIDVIAYAGSRGEERPRTILLKGRKVNVTAIVQRWIEEGAVKRTRKRFFHVQGDDNNSYRIYYDEQKRAWFYVS